MMNTHDDFTIYTWSDKGIDGHDFAVYAPMVNCRRDPVDAANKAYIELLPKPIGRRAIRFHAIDQAGYPNGGNWYEHDGRSFVQAATEGPQAERSVIWMRAFWSRLMQLAGKDAHAIIDRIILDHENFFRPYFWGTHFFEGASRFDLFEELRSDPAGSRVCRDALLAFVAQHQLVLSTDELWDSREMSAAAFARILLDPVPFNELESSALMDFSNTYGTGMIYALNDHYRTMEIRLLRSLVAECPVPVSVSNYNDRVLPDLATPGFTTRPQSRLGVHLPAHSVGGESSPTTYLFRSAAPRLIDDEHPMWQWTVLRMNEMMICKNLVPWIGLAGYQEQGQFDGNPYVNAPIYWAMFSMGCTSAILFNPDHDSYDCTDKTRSTLNIIARIRESASSMRIDQRVPLTLDTDTIGFGRFNMRKSDLLEHYRSEQSEIIPSRKPEDASSLWNEEVFHEAVEISEEE